MPASVITSAWPAEKIPPPDLYGLWWNGQGQAQWEGQSMDVSWRLDWRGLTPGLQLSLKSGQVSATGWAGADWGDWELAQWQVSIPVNLLNSLFPRGKADGRLDIGLSRLALAGSEIRAVDATLNYGGGTVDMGPGMARDVPPIQGVLAMQDGIPMLSVTGPDKQSLAKANLKGKTLTVEIFRALPLLLEMSEGGNASDVVFSTHQDLPVSAQSG
ncbi:MAG: type II secretion system protein N [Pseudomonadales bacterium]|nr:type II secretion system protein N [Pseudomonadales bacterium]